MFNDDTNDDYVVLSYGLEINDQHIEELYEAYLEALEKYIGNYIMVRINILFTSSQNLELVKDTNIVTTLVIRIITLS